MPFNADPPNRTTISHILNKHKIWFATDNGPEMNCPPKGICQNADEFPNRPKEGPGSAGILRGRKRDIFEGGHRVPGIISFPPQVQRQGTQNRDDNEEEAVVSWETVTTMDFLPTVMELLGVDRPIDQQSWAMDGRSILPLLKNASGFRWEDTKEGPRSFGLGNHDPKQDAVHGYGYRHGKWKYVEGSVSCTVPSCRKPMLFDLSNDLGERRDLSKVHPDVLEDLRGKFLEWHASVMKSRQEESNCTQNKDLVLPESLLRAKEQR